MRMFSEANDPLLVEALQQGDKGRIQTLARKFFAEVVSDCLIGLVYSPLVRNQEWSTIRLTNLPTYSFGEGCVHFDRLNERFCFSSPLGLEELCRRFDLEGMVSVD